MWEFDLFEAFAVLETFLLMVFLAAGLYFAFAYARRRGGQWPRVLGIAAVVRLVTLAIGVFAAVFSLWALSGSSPSVTPNLPVTYETWFLVGAIVALVAGAAELVAGLALIVGGWREGLKKGAGRKR